MKFRITDTPEWALGDERHPEREEEFCQLKQEVENLRAEIEMLRGIGCREAKLDEPESGPCGVCLKCAEERGAKWALDSVGWSREDDRWSIADRICRDAKGKR